LALTSIAILLTGCVGLIPLKRISGPGDDLAYVGQDGNVYGVKIDGGQPYAITRDVAPSQDQKLFSFWPTISPDGRRLASLRATIANGDIVDSGIYVSNLDGTGEVPIWQSTSDSPVYCAWSPDSTSLAMLVSDGTAVTLLLTRSIAATPERPVTVDQGHEVYFAWAPDSRSLLVHTSADSGASTLSQVDVTSPGLAAAKLAFFPSEFRSPDWSPSGRYQLIAGSTQGDRGELFLREASSDTLSSLGEFGSSAAFEWSPKGDKLAVGAGEPSLFGPRYSMVTVVDPASKRQTIVSRTGAFAFFWSPDGKRLAFLDAAPPDAIQWVVVDADGGNRHALEAFVPDRGYSELIGFFDQFAQSLSVWSTDSQYVVFSGWQHTPSLAIQEQSHVFVSRADGSGIVRDIEGGTSGYWRRVVASSPSIP
jgi:Tol biopolymer transport system component